MLTINSNVNKLTGSSADSSIASLHCETGSRTRPKSRARVTLRAPHTPARPDRRASYLCATTLRRVNFGPHVVARVTGST